MILVQTLKELTEPYQDMNHLLESRKDGISST
ncbi:MAG: hypothetical protein UZ03_NOB001000232 [Nitrospira sp. OLB3]|nr:MAG: hypothetical protein UZ03_NOB001000232 [Nitrospira sp. OLB3]